MSTRKYRCPSCKHKKYIPRPNFTIPQWKMECRKCGEIHTQKEWSEAYLDGLSSNMKKGYYK